MTSSDPIQWLTQHVGFAPATFGEFFYGRIEKWAPGGIAGINCEFDPADKTHFLNRGMELDFAMTVGGGRILDFGPGDGWPALRIAPMVKEVVGVDASVQRVETCKRNAQQACVQNAEFVLVTPGQPLPFNDDSFDGVVASWSLEETPDLETTLKELLRVMRPGAKMRFEPVPLSFIKADETSMYVGDAVGGRTIVMACRANTQQQKIHCHGLYLDLPQKDFRAMFARRGSEVAYEAITDELLAELRSHIIDAGKWDTRNPDVSSWLRWLPQLGFRHVEATYGGGWAAGRYFEDVMESPEIARPSTQAEADAILRPLVTDVITRQAPGNLDTPITAVK